MMNLDSIANIDIEEVVLFLGAGFSRNAGCKSWDYVVDLIKNMDCVKRVFDTQELKYLSKKEDNVDMLTTLVSCFEHDDWDKYWAHIYDSLRHNVELYNDEYRPLLTILKKIKPLPPIITTNIDDCLQYSDFIKLDKTLFTDEHFEEHEKLFINNTAAHLHGISIELRKAAFRNIDYLKVYTNNHKRSFLKGVIENKKFIFFGTSFRDKDLLRIFNEVKEEGSVSKHLGFIDSETKLNSTDRKYFDRMYNIEIHIYGNTSEFRNFLSDFVNTKLINVPVESCLGDSSEEFDPNE